MNAEGLELQSFRRSAMRVRDKGLTVCRDPLSCLAGKILVFGRENRVAVKELKLRYHDRDR